MDDIELLRQIRDDLRAIRDALGGGIAELRFELGRRLVASEGRIANAMTELGGSLRELRDRAR